MTNLEPARCAFAAGDAPDMAACASVGCRLCAAEVGEPVPAPPPEPEPARGLILSVYRPADLPGDCTNGGITAKANAVTVTGVRDDRFRRGRELPPVRPLPSMSRVFAPTDRAPEVTLVIRANGRGGRWLHLEPAGTTGQPGNDADGPLMAGGNWAGTSDSRWSELIGGGPGGGHPVSVHDRRETWAQYRALSKD
jgi:hypothetical protein